MTKSELIDKLDLMRDEFTRITVLTQNTEIQALCDRAVSDIEQTIPVLRQRDEMARQLDSIKTALGWYNR